MRSKNKQRERKEQSGKSRVRYSAPSSGPWNLTAQPVSSFQRAELISPRDRQDKVLEQDFSPAPCNTTAKLVPLLHFASDKDKQKQKEGNKELKKEKEMESEDLKTELG